MANDPENHDVAVLLIGASALAVLGFVGYGLYHAAQPEDVVHANALASVRPALKVRIRALVPEMIEKAQEVLDAWEQDDEGFDAEFGGGGACDKIAEAMGEVLAHRLPDVSLTEGGHDGDDHAYIVAYTDTEACTVDIPPGVYETGGGYSWKKREGVVLVPSDVVIDPLLREWIEE